MMILCNRYIPANPFTNRRPPLVLLFCPNIEKVSMLEKR